MNRASVPGVVQMTSAATVFEFQKADFPRTLYPINTNIIVSQYAGNTVLQYISDSILNDMVKDHSFLPQLKVFAAKPNWHLRRTFKLDPVAELFMYSFAYGNRKLFYRKTSTKRIVLGYRFKEGQMESPSKSYRSFKSTVSEQARAHKHYISFDIASYFNSIYHHDVVAWMAEQSPDLRQSKAIGQFLREINSGRSVDCLPHGLYPCKMLGNHFLSFVDRNARIKSDVLVRFMDDFYLFDDDESRLISDFIYIQKLLGEKGLSVNPSKTTIGRGRPHDIKRDIDRMKIQLLKKRRYTIEISGEDVEMEDESLSKLTRSQVKYLIDILQQPDIEEEDAELVLSLMRDHSDEVLEHLERLIEMFPHLAKNIYYFAAHVTDRTELLGIILSTLQNRSALIDFQLFWLAKICEDYLLKKPGIEKALHAIFDNGASSEITKAKILEIPDNRFGLPELRREQLTIGRSDWLSWASAVGCRSEKPVSRNHMLKYFAKGSATNHLVAEAVIGCP